MSKNKWSQLLYQKMKIMDREYNGFTLIELIAVIAIIGIIVTLVSPKLIGIIRTTEKRVCITNQKTVEKMYNTLLLENEYDFNDNLFNQYVIENFDEVCPSNGVISYLGGKVKCSLHEDESVHDSDIPPSEEVPWL